MLVNKGVGCDFTATTVTTTAATVKSDPNSVPFYTEMNSWQANFCDLDVVFKVVAVRGAILHIFPVNGCITL
jgi:hypothetical protein